MKIICILNIINELNFIILYILNNYIIKIYLYCFIIIKLFIKDFYYLCYLFIILLSFVLGIFVREV